MLCLTLAHGGSRVECGVDLALVGGEFRVGGGKSRQAALDSFLAPIEQHEG